MPSSLPSLAALTESTVRVRLGTATTAMGTAYAREGKVAKVTWDFTVGALRASVQGTRPKPYSTIVVLELVDATAVDIAFGRCSCPMISNCKHVAAVLLHVMRTSGGDGPPRSFDHWSHALDPVLRTSTSMLRTAEGTIGLQFALSTAPARPERLRLMARPVRRNERGSWVTTGISWDRLPYSSAPGSAAQLESLRELFVLSKFKGGSPHYYYQQTTSIDLAELPSRFLWDLLDDASARGVEFVHAKRSLGSVGPVSSVTFDVDLTSSPAGELVVTGRVRRGDDALDPRRLAFLGDDGAGLVYWEPEAEDDLAKRAFRLGRLTDPISPALVSLASSPTPLAVPRDEQASFSARYLPAIRRQVSVVSTDSSYVEPTVCGPDLDLVVTYSTGHQVTVTGQWEYTVDDTPLSFATDTPAVFDGTRDLDAERRIAGSVTDALGLPGTDGTIGPFTEHGMAAVDFLSKSVPALMDLVNINVRVVGDPPEFFDVSDDVTIAVSTKTVRGETDWFDLAIDVTVDGTKVPLADLIAGIAHDESHLLLSDGRYFDLQIPRLRRLRDLVTEARALSESPRGPLRLSRFQASLWEELAALGVVKRQAKAWKAQVSGLLALDSVAPTPAPIGLDANLRSYQLDGLSWLAFVFDHRLGGILADDMGLGKTIQTLALIQRAHETHSMAGPFLIVAPTSVVHNWASEAERFTPNLNVVTVTNTQAKSMQPLADLVGDADIVVTSYAIFRIDFDEFERQSWTGLVLDEAQNVKNHQGKTYQCARRLSTSFKLAITGTPMENNVMELWALLSITSPGLFPSPKSFTDIYRRPIENDGDSEALARLRRRIRPLLMRRTKELVASDLPAKQEQVVEVDLYPKHRKIYDTILNRERQKILGLLDDFDRNRFTILTSLTLLRQLSLDPALVDPTYRAIPSAKTDELVAQLVEIAAGGHRALVFSQFTHYLERIRERLTQEGIAFEYLDGRSTRRGAIVKRFRTGEAPVFLISLKAGGVGLTLTEADYCFVLDPWWNPATEAQAVDRAHRIGQTNTVFVNRYVARDTIEEKVMVLKERKAKLFSSVLDDGGAFSGSLSADDIRGLIE